MSRPYILIVFVSQSGSTRNLAHSVARGVNACQGIEARVRTVPAIDALLHPGKKVEQEQIAEVTQEDLKHCAGLAIGSPTHFGNMTSSLQYWIEGQTGLWMSGALVDKPVCVFTSSAGLHGGQETTLINMLTPLLHQGMMVLGVPYVSGLLAKTAAGGTPYGATHVAHEQVGNQLTEEEHAIAIEQGRRLGRVALLMQAES